MIHYTLLPEKEIKILKREYRFRLLIFVLFFMSFAIMVGTISLIPSFLFSYSLEKESLTKIEELHKNRKDDEIKAIITELGQSTKLMNKLANSDNSVVFSHLISKIIGHKPKGLFIRSFDLSVEKETASSTSVLVTIQGKSTSREALVSFRDRLSSDPLILSVDLPVSDLAKSKDILYSIKISINQIK